MIIECNISTHNNPVTLTIIASEKGSSSGITYSLKKSDHGNLASSTFSPILDSNSWKITVEEPETKCSCVNCSKAPKYNILCSTFFRP